jgi:hypothetical protein
MICATADSDRLASPLDVMAGLGRGARRAALEFSVNASSTLNYFPSAEAWVDDLRLA